MREHSSLSSVPLDSPGCDHPLRVLVHAGGIAGAYAGSLLARLGADVGLIEGRPDGFLGGDPVRFAYDFYLDGLKTRAKKPRAGEWGLAADALGECDLLLTDCLSLTESCIGRSLEEVRASYPRLVVGVTSVFGGEEGRKVSATCLDAQAVSGVSWVLGEPASAPLSFPPGVVEHQAGSNLAAASLLACLTARETGSGRVVDVALAEVLASYVGVNCRYYIPHGMKWRRAGRRPYASAGTYPFVILPCKDGAVTLVGVNRDEWLRMVKAMGDPVWTGEPRYQRLRAMGTKYPEEVDALVSAWLADITRDQFDQIAADFKLTAVSIRTVDEVIEYPQLKSRKFFGRHVVEGQSTLAPGLPFRMTQSREEPAAEVSGHMLCAGMNEAVRCPLGRDDRPLGGLRVLDFGWVWSAPWVTGLLTEYGAEVIKVEHRGRMDGSRLLGAVYRDDVMVDGDSTEMSPLFHQINHGKKSVSLNLKNPEAVLLLRSLARTCDVVIENMVPGAMDRAGLGYETLSQEVPGLVMLSMSGAGQFGPLSGMRTYAPLMSSYGGLDSLVGYRGKTPLGCIGFGFGDPSATTFGLLALLAALYRRQTTGEGVFIDLAQTESLICNVTPYLLAAQRLGVPPVPLGNGDAGHAPHGIYPAAGDDQWLTISAATPDQWNSLRRLDPESEWSCDARFQTPEDRIRHRDLLDAALSRWTQSRDRDALSAQLRAAGVASSPVLSIEEQRDYPLFRQRCILQGISIPEYGREDLYRSPWRFSDSEPRIEARGPRLGEHTREVLTASLGLSEDEYDRVLAAGVFD